MTYKFTKSAQAAIEIANDIAIELGHDYVGTQHLLYGLVKEGTGGASKVLETQNVNEEDVLNYFNTLTTEYKNKQIKTILTQLSADINTKIKNLNEQ